MDRHQHKKYVPQCPRHAAIVDQYMWEEKDTTKYMCYNGISHPIYDCKGYVSFSLPLEEYPVVDQIHPQIQMTRRMHMNFREDPRHRPTRENFIHKDLRENRVEGLYIPKSKVLAVNKLPTVMPTGCSSCGGTY